MWGSKVWVHVHTWLAWGSQDPRGILSIEERPGFVYCFWRAFVHIFQVALVGLGWMGQEYLEMLMVVREGLLLLLDSMSGSRWVPAWLVILARVVTWRCKRQLLIVCSSFGV